jgi:hypothetical protein
VIDLPDDWFYTQSVHRDSVLKYDYHVKLQKGLLKPGNQTCKESMCVYQGGVFTICLIL